MITKARPVINGCYRYNNSPLNQAAYTGTDLMNSLFELLLSFRSNKVVLLADISKGFLNIMLKTNFDRNRFFFALYDISKFKSYRYTTPVFRFIARASVLNYILEDYSEK